MIIYGEKCYDPIERVITVDSVNMKIKYPDVNIPLTKDITTFDFESLKASSYTLN